MMQIDQVVSGLRMRRLLPASPELVFAALTRAEMLRHWICPEGFRVVSAEADARVGGRLRIAMRSPEGQVFETSGVYREVTSGELLVFTWTWQPSHTMAGVETVIRIELTAQGDGTMVTMTHTGLPTQSERDSHAWGWTGAFDHLEQLLRQQGAQ